MPCTGGRASTSTSGHVRSAASSCAGTRCGASIAGDVCVAAYAPFLTGAEDDYAARLHDVATRDAEAEVWVAGRLAARAWIEDPYEEKEGWPDGADGVGEAPLRLSKRGSWLSIEAARFPGVPAGENGYFQLEDLD